VLHESKLVGDISNYAIRYGRYNSFIGHNALFCAQRYAVNIEDIGNITKPKGIIYSNFNELVESS
jgi:RES domain-containing protein